MLEFDVLNGEKNQHDEPMEEQEAQIIQREVQNMEEQEHQTTEQEESKLKLSDLKNVDVMGH